LFVPIVRVVVDADKEIDENPLLRANSASPAVSTTSPKRLVAPTLPVFTLSEISPDSDFLITC
jgi:hypothetical protein